jgi:pimeloyl-ACP methyl ester carboxylesterase
MPSYSSIVSSETRYASNGELQVAYRAFGEGPRDIVFVSNWFTNVEVMPELSVLGSWLEAMTTLGRVIFFDQPGTGASDPVTIGSLPTLEQWADSITAILDDLGSSEAVLITADGAFATGALFSATYPARTSALVVLEGSAFSPVAEQSQEARDDQVASFAAMWGTGELQHVLNPEMPWNEEIRAAFARHERLAASPKTVNLFFSVIAQFDVREILSSVRVPTLVLQNAKDEIFTAESGRDLADHIPGA